MPWVVPFIGPDDIRKGRWSEGPAQVAYFERAVRLCRGQSVEIPDVTRPPPGSLLRPTLRTLAQFDREIPNWPALSIDIENAGHFITLLGITLFSPAAVGSTLSLPFRSQHGLDYWQTWPEHLQAVGYLYRWLADPRTTKVFHNGVAHDVPILEETGFIVNGPLDDTMVQVHWCYPEMKKSLVYNAIMYCGFPNWKTLLDEDDDAEGKS